MSYELLIIAHILDIKIIAHILHIKIWAMIHMCDLLQHYNFAINDTSVEKKNMCFSYKRLLAYTLTHYKFCVAELGLLSTKLCDVQLLSVQWVGQLVQSRAGFTNFEH